MFRTSNNLPLLAALFIALALGAAAPLFTSDSPAGHPLEFGPAKTDLPQVQPVPQFELSSASGGKFSPGELKGTVWVANFFFTSCKGPCPRMVEQLLRIYDRRRADADFAAVSITIDPQTDTAEHLAAFAGNLKVDTRKWKFLTGPLNTIVTLSNEGFFLGADDKNGHSAVFVLIDRNGMVRGYYQSADPEKMARLDVDIDRLLSAAPESAD